MTQLKINDQTFNAELLEAPPPPSGASAAQRASHDKSLDSFYNIPFHDELYIRLDTGAAPKYYVARLSSTAITSNLIGSPVEVDGARGLVVGGIEDEGMQSSYTLNDIEINFGFLTPDGEAHMVDPEAFGIGNPEKFKEKIIEQLGINAGDSIGVEKFEELTRPGGLIDQLKANDKIVDTYANCFWETKGESVTFKILLAPPMKEFTTAVHLDSTTAMPEEEKIAFETEIRSFFTPPLTWAELESGIKKTEERFKTNEHYYLDQAEFVYGANSELTIHFGFKPVPKELELKLNALGHDGQPMKTEPPPFPVENLATPFTEENMEKNLPAIERFYQDKGYIMIPDDKGHLVVPVSASAEKAVFEVILMPAPREIEIGGDKEHGPSLEELQEMFRVPGQAFATNYSIDSGIEALTKWYSKQGMLLRPGEPRYEIEGNILRLVAHPAVLAGEVQIEYIKDGDTAEMGETQGRNVKSEFEQTGGEVFDMHALDRSIGRLTQNYPLAVDPKMPYEIVAENPDNPDSVTIKIRLVDISPSVQAHAGGAATKVGSGEEGYWGGNASGGAAYRLIDGKRVAGSLAYSGDAVDQVLTGTASFTVPWIDKRGTTVTVGGYGLAVLNAEEARAGTTSGYDHIVGASTRFNIPFRIHSPWSVITGVKVEGIFDPADGFEALWGKPDIGIGYGRDNTMAAVIGGPRVSSDGQVYGEITAVEGQKIPLTKNKHLHVDLRAEAGVRGGQVTEDQMYRGSSMLPNYGGYRDEIGTAHAGARADIMYDFTVGRMGKVLAAGAGLSADTIATPDGASNRVGTGFRVDFPWLGATILLGPAIEQEPSGVWSDPTVGITFTAEF